MKRLRSFIAGASLAAILPTSAVAGSVIVLKTEGFGLNAPTSEATVYLDGTRIRIDSKETGADVTVIYNGVPKKIKAHLDETVKKLLEHAIHVFSPIPQPHLLGLFTEAGQELNDAQTVREAGVKEHDKLLLRPSAVRGG